MLQITDLTNDPTQIINIDTEDTEETVQFTFRWCETQPFLGNLRAWFYDVKYFGANETIEYTNRRLVCGINILELFSNILPFGLLVNSPYDIEPFTKDDFISSKIELFLLNQEEVTIFKNSSLAELGIDTDKNNYTAQLLNSLYIR
jgi:hypothetical protein